MMIRFSVQTLTKALTKTLRGTHTQAQPRFRTRTRLPGRLRSQRGAYLVEFALTFALFMVMLTACIEVARLLYTWGALTFATQRGARVAAVCPINDAKIAEIALVSAGDGAGSSFIPGVGVENISVSYHDENGNSANRYLDIRYVTVSVVGYRHNLLITDLFDGIDTGDVLAPSFSTTLPAESLGFDPGAGTRICTV